MEETLGEMLTTTIAEENRLAGGVACALLADNGVSVAAWVFDRNIVFKESRTSNENYSIWREQRSYWYRKLEEFKEQVSSIPPSNPPNTAA